VIKNDDYLNEIKKPELKNAFANITRLYNYIWYGDFSIDEPKYKKAAIDFTGLKKTIEKNG